MNIQIPELSLVVLIGPSGSGKSSFAKKHFKPTETISSDVCRGLVSDNENDQKATAPAFEVLHFIVSKRLANGKLTVVDATNVQKESRASLLRLAKQHDVLPVAIVLNLPAKLCHKRNQNRPDRQFGPHVTRQHHMQLRRSLRDLKREGFRQIIILDKAEDIDAVEITRTPLWNNLKSEKGPFDIIGDIHGCYEELKQLLLKLGYIVEDNQAVYHPEGRRAIFVGDLIDRGPNSPAVLRLVMAMVKAKNAFCVPGNHEQKYKRKLSGKDVKLTHGLKETVEQMAQEPESFHKEVLEFIDSLVSHLIFDGGALVVAHAGMKQEFQGRASGRVRSFALYGDTTGETDEYGAPIRQNWATDYRGTATVVYGHTPVLYAEWFNNTICIDTGCVFGGRLTALRYPERELIDVQAQKVYYEPIKPLEPINPLSVRQEHILDIKDVEGKHYIETKLRGSITIQAENAAAALEVMSRYCIDPRWLIYLPPTMSPPETSDKQNILEHPNEAFTYYKNNNVTQVLCEEKHMGSRAVIIVCKSQEVVNKRFRINSESLGVIYTRTGRAFFKDPNFEKQIIDRLQSALTQADYWNLFKSDWFCFDVEIMPWSAKAQELLINQYAPVSAAGIPSLNMAIDALKQAKSNNIDVSAVLPQFEEGLSCLEKYTSAYRQYCWPVESIHELKIAPFHIMASESALHTDKDHLWHMNMIDQLCDTDPQLLHKTSYIRADLTDYESELDAIHWWERLTKGGGEGMVVKPLTWVNKSTKSIVQPAIKCRGPEYLRIIYGPEYSMNHNIERLRSRSVRPKRSLAIREFVLGIEGLQRFVGREPLYRVHECVFGVLALESEPVDPRL